MSGLTVRSEGPWRAAKWSDAFTRLVIDGQVALAIKQHRPDGVVVVVRPIRGDLAAIVAGPQRIGGWRDVIVFPRYQ